MSRDARAQLSRLLARIASTLSCRYTFQMLRALSVVCVAAAIGCSSDYSLAPGDGGSSTGGSGASVSDSGWNVDGGGTGGAGGNSGSAGSAGSSGSAGAPGGENCSNGVDDNGDKLVDCADPLCASATCVAVPPNWLGPVHYASATSLAALPSCPGGVAPVTEGGSGTLSVQPLGCAACSCAKPSGATCQIQSAKAYSLGSCSNANQKDYTALANKCTNLPDVGNAPPSSVKPPQIAAVGASCAPSGGAETSRPKPAFPSFGRVCLASTGGGCKVGEQCAPPAPAGFDSKVCISRPGGHACPAPFNTKTLLHNSGNFADTRTCGKCSCGQPAGNYCDGKVEFFMGADCTQKHPEEFTLPTTDCRIGGAIGWPSIWVTVGTEQGGSCKTTQAAQSGTATPTGANTVCCM